MGAMFKCDLTGKVDEGRGALNFDVHISDGFKFRITPHVTKDGRVYDNGVLCQDAIIAVTKALQDKFGKPKDESDASKPVPR